MEFAAPARACGERDPQNSPWLSRQQAGMLIPDDDRILQVLRGVNDPELGFNIVDLGLVYRARFASDEIDVAFTLTTPSCPMGEYLIEEVRDVLGRAFPDARAVHVALTWDPPWSSERMSAALRKQLG